MVRGLPLSVSVSGSIPDWDHINISVFRIHYAIIIGIAIDIVSLWLIWLWLLLLPVLRLLFIVCCLYLCVVRLWWFACYKRLLRLAVRRMPVRVLCAPRVCRKHYINIFWVYVEMEWNWGVCPAEGGGEVSNRVLFCSSAYDRGRMSPYRADHRGHSNASNGYSSGGQWSRVSSLHLMHPCKSDLFLILVYLLRIDLLNTAQDTTHCTVAYRKLIKTTHLVCLAWTFYILLNVVQHR